MLPADSLFAPLPAPGPHPAPAELRAYVAGTLGPTEEHRIEAHALDCERCADVLAGLALSDPATTDRAVAELRARLQARVGPAGSVPAAGGWAWPRLAAAAALLSVVAGGIWSWQHYEPVPATARLETAAPASAPNATPSGAPAPAQASKIAAAEAPSAISSPAVPAAEPVATDALASSAAPRSATPVPPASPRPADYAASAGAPVPPRGGFGSMAKPAARPAAAAAARYDLSSRESEMIASKEAADMALATPAPAAAMRRPSGTTALAAPTADTLPPADAARLGRQYAEAKASISASAAENTARVSATPMPTAPAINPAPVGGTVALREHLRREAAAFEPEAGATRLSGLVRLRFTVGADGKVSNLHVVRGLRPDYDAEALRLLCEGPAWQPGVAGGRRAPLPVETTVAF